MGRVTASTVKALQVRGRAAIGPGLPAYVIAEIGTNHNQDFETAKTMVVDLAKTGCDCAKFQIYEPDEIVSGRVRAADYGFDHIYGDISAQEMFERFLKTPKAWFPELRSLCHDLGMDFSATIHGADGLAWAQRTGLDVVKVASMDHTNTPFLESLVNAVDAPILLSSGMADVASLDAAMAIAAPHHAGIGLFHCVSVYPAPVEVARLSNIAYLTSRYAAPIGFSDHTLGIDAARAARRAGAVVFEKHVTLDKTQAGPDHSFAMEMHEFKEYVAAVKAVDVAAPGALAPEFLMPVASEWENRKLALKSVIARRDLEAGAVISESDVYLARPGTGIAPSEFRRVLGRRLVKRVAAEMPLQWSDVERAD